MPSLLIAMTLGAPPADMPMLQGTWRITALVDNGQALSEKQIENEFARDRVVHFEGPVLRFQPPYSRDERRLPVVINTNTTPWQVDVSGGERVGPKGILNLIGDSLVVCLGGQEQNDRPSEFSSPKDSGRILMTMTRVKPVVNTPPQKPPTTTPVVPLPTPPATTSNDDTVRRNLIGTWGHQDENVISYVTFNGDGSYSSVLTWKKGFEKLFNKEVRSSGTWKVDNGVVIVHITASTEPDHRNQVYSFRLVSLSATDLVGIDGLGRSRREWRVR
jgi:uncharacterized protein (TIGR03067 family)